MSVLKSLRMLARYNVLTPVALLAMATPIVAMAADVGPGATSGTITLSDGENLTNSGTITQSTVPAAVIATTNAGTILNNASGIIESSLSGGNAAIYVAGNTLALVNNGTIRGLSTANVSTIYLGSTGAEHVGSFENNAGGTISATSTTSPAVHIYGSIDSFANAGTISSLASFSSTLVVDGTVGSFSNTGIVTGEGLGAYLKGDVTTFRNAGSIASTDQGVLFDNSVATFSNSGTITGTSINGVEFGDTVGTFSNLADGTMTGYRGVVAYQDVGSFSNAGSITGTGSSATAVTIYGDVSAFNNSGTISNTANASYGIVLNGATTSFSNSGTISGSTVVTGSDATNGIGVAGTAFGTFSNTGSITGRSAVWLSGSVTSFSNAGALNGLDGNGAYFGASVGTFANSGTIVGSRLDGAYFLGNVSSLTNSGTISGVGTTGVSIRGLRVFGNAGTIVNSGQITSLHGIAVAVGGTLGNLINSGTLSGGGGTALSVTGGGDDKLTILTGSEIFGSLAFNGGNDTLDFSGFAGNTVLDVGSLDTLAPGSRSFFDLRDVNGTGQVAILDISGLGNQAIGQSTLDMLLTSNQLISGQMDDTPEENAVPTAFAPELRTPALDAVDTAVLTELDTRQRAGTKVWGSFVGGGVGGTEPVDMSSVYGGIVFGAHAQFDPTFTLGGTAGYVTSKTSTLGGQQTLETQTGLVGVYGRVDLGVVDLDMSLIGGVSAHTSEREVVAGGTTETARGMFDSMFIAPGLGITVPVLRTEAGELVVKGSVTYVAGTTTAYTETGSSMNLEVGEQTISALDARLGLESRQAIGMGDGIVADFVARAGVLAQANGGSADVPVTAFAQTLTVATPGSSALGVYGGVGIEAALSDSVDLNINVDGSFRTDGVNSVSIKGSIGGAF